MWSPHLRILTSAPPSHSSQDRRLLSALHTLEWLLLLIAVAYFTGRTLPRAWRTLNTDFPNYYITAHLLRQNYNCSRVYEWTWIQRQKNHLQIEQPVVGFIPLTPISALPIVPLTYLPPLQAKRAWILLNVALLAAVILLLHSITHLALHRIALLAALTFPLHHNLVLGQAYILLLAILTFALWLYLRGYRTTAGVFLGAAFAMKIFPALFLLYFLRKRAWRAAFGLILGSCAAIVISLILFGVEMNRTYALQVLPWALRGEALDPYNLQANSISALLHHLFVFEPEWNPHPLIHLPLLFAILHPLLQLLIFSPALLLSCPYQVEPERTRLEWSVFAIALMTISTSPAFYDFTLLLLPATVLTSTLMLAHRWRMLAVFLVLYLAACYPFPNRNSSSGWHTLLAVPRLYLLILLCAFGCALMYQGASRLGLLRDRRSWIAALVLGMVAAITLNIRHQRDLYDAYRWRLPLSADIFSASSPVPYGNATLFTAMLKDGYRAGELTPEGLRIAASLFDQLFQTATTHKRWWEESAQTSQVMYATPLDDISHIEITQAESPVISPDGNWLAFQRSERGSARLWLRSIVSKQEFPITPPELNVMEMSFFPDDTLAFSASSSGPPHLFLVDHAAHIHPFSYEEARYPAVSPDGRWLAFSLLRRGIWNLWLRDLRTGQAQAITSAECNNISPAWESDSKTLLYASDCGRGLWLTSLCRRRVLP